MIKARVAPNKKLLIIFDGPNKDWKTAGVLSNKGINALLKQILDSGISLDDVSAVCLHDNLDKPKVADYKAKEPYIRELIDTYGYNLLMPVGAAAFDKVSGIKGASKNFNRVIKSTVYQTKLVACPNPSAAAYDPSILEVVNKTIKTVKAEMEFPGINEVATVPKNYVLIDSLQKFNKFYNHFNKNVFRFALDIEASSLQFNVGNILTIQFSDQYNTGYCIPTNHYQGSWDSSEWDYIVSKINYLIEDDSREKIGANIYFDLKYLNHHYGTKLVKENVTDVLIASFLVDENRESHSLKYCAATLLKDAGDYERPLDMYREDYCKKNKIKKAEFTYDLIPLEILFPYSCMDVDYTLQLADYFKIQLVLEDQEQVFKDVSSYAWALARIEKTGWKIDLEEVNRYKNELESRINELSNELTTLPEIVKAVTTLNKNKLDAENSKRKTPLQELKTPIAFLVNSSNHKRLLFKDILKLPEVKKTKSGAYATDKECFSVWSEAYPEIPSIKTIKKVEELKKMLGTYVKALLTRTVNGRVHCSFRVCGAATGRISCTQPNLQNVAAHSEEAQKLKKCFVAEEGHSLVVADLSNAELRITAALSGDPVMVNGFKQGLDPHGSVAKEVFELDCPVEKVKELYNDKRQTAKVLGFAALYGASSSVIAKNARISNEAAQELLDEYFRKYTGVKKMLNDNASFTKKNGYCLSILGRKRRVPQVFSEDNFLSSRAIRQANNFIVQSVASDGMLQSIVNMWNEIDEKKLPYKIINVIHDSCEMEAPDECIKEAHEFLIRHLSVFPRGLEATFPMLADGETGKTWESLKSFGEDSFLEYEDNYDEDEEDSYDEAA